MRAVGLVLFRLERALSAFTGSAGLFAIPFALDPTIILSSSGVLNPLRDIASVETIAVTTWKGVSSDGVSASYTAEATEVGDNSPVLAQPTATVQKSQVFVPFSIEVGNDWPGLQAELAGMMSDAKNTLEATKFLLGVGDE